MSVSDRTPVIIGVGEASERIDAPDYAALSPADLAARAAATALADAGADGLAAHIDVVAAIPQFEVSGPRVVAPFGASNNFPRSLARRVGADPVRAIWEAVGGQGPQHLVNELAHAIAAGEAEMALIAGSEAISTVRHLQAKGETRDWAEIADGAVEDRRFDAQGMLTAELVQHGARTPISVYAMFENARRAREGKDRAAYALEMGRLFAPFTQVAAGNPHAMSREVYSPEALATVTERNRLTSDPFPRRMVARDQANQGAAVLLTSVGKARALGVPQDRWIYLWGGADVKERTPVERADLSRGPASVAAAKRALEAAGVDLSDIGVIDLYSCFPIAVFNICDGLGLAPDDPRGLTVTGGLPFFGGAGNNYSMHAIAEMVRRLRARPGAVGFLGANGGFLSKYSVGIYSSAERAFQPFDSKPLQAEVDAWTAPALDQGFEGEAAVETYTIDYAQASPRGVVVARSPARARVVAMTDDPAVAREMIETDPLGRRVTIAAGDQGLRRVQGFSG
ncbi:MAG: acetyl-CoA acetyltransferase [Phenylobacterium sp.]|uniref:acetyl-CoA acetyltransferase n=1 Tax=Phenylobacterium sp. TaxID=1871053 RepID=UPI001A5BD5AC|nr:acetyl-CoA acetyltransferase [Phenylobacterium sp.]MBL8773331.1 acetyl-CoA acetyltransferase [Phenylobacterium sp.]